MQGFPIYDPSWKNLYQRPTAPLLLLPPIRGHKCKLFHTKIGHVAKTHQQKKEEKKKTRRASTAQERERLDKTKTVEQKQSTEAKALQNQFTQKTGQRGMVVLWQNKHRVRVSVKLR